MKRTFRSVFISDVHLGTKACQAHHLQDFLQQITTDRIYLVGDIVDLIEMRKKAHFPHEHQRIIETLLHKAASGTEVIYIPGNHDAFFRKFCGQTLSGVRIERQTIHTTADGRRFLVSHGDEFDQLVKISPVMLAIGDQAHGFMLAVNRHINRIRRWLGLPYWSLAGFIKSHIGKAQEFIQRFETAAIKSARSMKLDGYIGGHIHFARFQLQDNTLYCNDGDWVEHCTALVESPSGELSLIHWSEQPRHLATEPATVNTGAQPHPALS
ncbi:UDP-2,3-diacylglucosamine diphosphatase [Maribrevibacterium harenarium]|uniref:UDP-2,3-diacylglucosamine diphosphatase n=1 Tax=Maribrevibacterium harenarium TaxID=2589817 RepID=A0A501WEE2_9GAMM|nr:UDP-2,3-diacylglucosamine diphosphatase [Maribrevibacterium harenarium]TPE46875.1 UDP-2,3-diacylglucosamine diphosphatase [Maribrevibacterium harenarium]